MPPDRVDDLVEWRGSESFFRRTWESDEDEDDDVDVDVNPDAIDDDFRKDIKFWDNASFKQVGMVVTLLREAGSATIIKSKNMFFLSVDFVF
mmetsp:Transcript_8905/g.14294  ORF Transcript_8905/g.14294 Transcript_8905/m.14294 type:complete len:92 (+) Transcript_8905:276-551(+)